MLTRLTTPLQMAGIMQATLMMTHTSANAQVLKPVAVHAAQSPSAGQATAPSLAISTSGKAPASRATTRTTQGRLMAEVERADAGRRTWAAKAVMDRGRRTSTPDGDATKISTSTKCRRSEASEVLRDLPRPQARTRSGTGSQHDQRNVGCVTCHSVHAPKGRSS